MRSHRIAMFSSLVVMTVLLALVIWQRAGRTADLEPHAVQLRSGESLDGVLMRLQESAYLLQTEDECLILPAHEIKKIDGKAPVVTDLPVSNRVPRLQETFEDISSDGQVELHSTFYRTNRGSKVVTGTNWGMGEHEYPHLETYRIVDEFGNSLPFQVAEDPSIDGKRIRVQFARPILPGETVQFTTIFKQKDRVEKDGETWVYQMGGNYPDDRLVTRSVRLPEGAEIISVSPEPLYQVTSCGRPLVMWRRYFLRGEEVPSEIKYTL